MNLYPGYSGLFISPVTGRLASYEQLPELDRGHIWIGQRHSKKAVPSLKVIDLRVDVNHLLDEVTKIVSFPYELPFIIKSPSPLAPNAQALSELGEGVAKILEDGAIGIGVPNTDYITPTYLTEQLSNYVLTAAFPALFTSNYTSAIATSLSAYTTTVVTTAIASALALYNTTVILPEIATSITAALVTYTSVTVDPHITTAINGLNVNLTGAITASGLLNTTVITSFAPNPILPGVEATTIPTGTTAQRPASPVIGMIRANSDNLDYEQYDGTSWNAFITGLQVVANQLEIFGTPSRPAIGLVDDPYLFGTGYLKIPAGTTLERPISPIAGMIRFNTTLGYSEQYNGTTWLPDTFGTVTSVSAGVGLTGGVITASGTISLQNNVSLPGVESVKIPIGNTSQRPLSPVFGMIRANTTINGIETYISGSWTTLNTGGGVTSVGITTNSISALLVTNSPITSSGNMNLFVHGSLDSLVSDFTPGIIARVNSNVCANRAIVCGTGLTVTNGTGTSGNPTIELNTELQALSVLSSTGIVSRTASATYTPRTITASTGITITNGDGVSNNPTIGLSAVGTAGTYNNPIAITTNVQGQITTITTGTGDTPVGSIVMFGAATIPTGWLLCDGSLVSTTIYSTLFAVIGNSFGSGTSQFRVPDFRGVFPRGVNGARGTPYDDPDNTSRVAAYSGGAVGNNVGSIQGDAMLTHGHTMSTGGAHQHYWRGYWTAAGGSGNQCRARGYLSGDPNDAVTDGSSSDGQHIHSINNYLGKTEVRPRNLYVNFIIRALP